MREPLIVTEGIGMCEEAALYVPERLTPQTPVLLMLHGMWARRTRWDRFGPFFSKHGFLAVAPTYRYHEKYNQYDPIGSKLGKTSTLDYVADAESVARALYCGKLLDGFIPSQPPIVMGHSLSGLVSRFYASCYPVSAVIPACSAPDAGQSLYQNKDYQKRARKNALKILRGKPFKPDVDSYSLYILNGMLEGLAPAEQERLRRSLYDAAVYESGTAAREVLAGSSAGLPRLLAQIGSRPIFIEAQNIRSPMLIIGGEIDRVTPPQIARDLYEKYRDWANPCDVHIFEKTAHWFQYEPGWEARAEFILDWINRNVLSPSHN